MLYVLPTAEEVRIASRLRPEQVSALFANTLALEADIEERITEQAAVVERRLLQSVAPFAWPLTEAQVSAAFPQFTGEQVTAWQEDQARIISLCVKYLSLGDLYDSAGQLSPRYQAEAENYLGRGMRLLDQLASEAERVASNANGGESIPEANAPRSASGRLRPVWH